MEVKTDKGQKCNWSVLLRRRLVATCHWEARMQKFNGTMAKCQEIGLQWQSADQTQLQWQSNEIDLDAVKLLPQWNSTCTPMKRRKWIQRWRNETSLRWNSLQDAVTQSSDTRPDHLGCSPEIHYFRSNWIKSAQWYSKQNGLLNALQKLTTSKTDAWNPAALKSSQAGTCEITTCLWQWTDWSQKCAELRSTLTCNDLSAYHSVVELHLSG